MEIGIGNNRFICKYCNKRALNTHVLHPKTCGYKSCKLKLKRDYYRLNREKFLKRQVEYYKKHKKKIDDYNRKYQKENKEKVREKDRQYYLKNKDDSILISSILSYIIFNLFFSI